MIVSGSHSSITVPPNTFMPRMQKMRRKIAIKAMSAATEPKIEITIRICFWMSGNALSSFTILTNRNVRRTVTPPPPPEHGSKSEHGARVKGVGVFQRHRDVKKTASTSRRETTTMIASNRFILFVK